MKKIRVYLLFITVIFYNCWLEIADLNNEILDIVIEDITNKKTYRGDISNEGIRNEIITFDTLPNESTKVIVKTFITTEYDKSAAKRKAVKRQLPVEYIIFNIETKKKLYSALKEGDTLSIGNYYMVNNVYCCRYNMYITKHALSEVSTGTISGITISGASVEGSLENIGSIKVTSHGHLWHTNDTALSLTGSGISKNDIGLRTTTGSFITNINGLNENTTYYVRSFATSSIGTSYGEIKNFKTTSE